MPAPMAATAEAGQQATVAIRFGASGLVYLPGEDGRAAEHRMYAVLQDGGAFLVNLGAMERADGATPLEPVPAGAQDAIRDQHPGRQIVFPSVLESGPSGAPAAPGPAFRLLWVDPMKINLLYGGDDPREATRRHDEVLDGDWDVPRSQRFDETDIYKALEGHLLRGESWESTTFFRRVTRALKRGETKFGCSTVEELRARKDLIEDLYEQIRAGGYRTQEELGTGRPGDEIRVAIDRHGRFLFLDGRHRLAIARLLGIPQVPVRVTMRHARWEAFREEIWEYARKREGRVYQQLDHPDLAEIPAHHGTERVDMIRRALEGYDPAGKKLLDIGTHWGYMARAMEKLGFDATGVEYNRRNASFAERLARSVESGLTVWHGNIFEYPEPEKFEVVLALNIFHHLIKTEELHQGLIDFLGRLDRVEVIFFEPHLSEVRQLRDAYRNYESQEFAQFVAQHAGMSGVEYLGAAADGRDLYKITR